MEGCPGVKGEHVSSLKNESDESRHVREVRQDHAESRGLTGRDVSHADVKKLGNAQNQREHSAAKEAARGTGHSTASVLRALPAAHQNETADQQMFRPAIERLQKLTGATPARVRDWAEVHNRDWSTWPEFDLWSRNVAAEHPELGMDKADHDTPQRMWDLLLSEGKRTKAIESHSPKVAQTAVAMLGKPIRQKRGDAAETSGDTSFNPDQFSRRIALAASRYQRFPIATLKTVR